MAERLQLNVATTVTLTGWDIYSLYLGRVEKRIEIQLTGDDGDRRTELIDGTTAAALLVSLNTANLSIKSLYRRVIEWLIANRGYSGTVAGTPDV